MTVYYIWLFLFGVVGYFVVTDESIATFVNHFIMGVWVQIRIYYYLVRFHPLITIKNPIARYFMNRKYRKMAEEMIAKLKEQGHYKEES